MKTIYFELYIVYINNVFFVDFWFYILLLEIIFEIFNFKRKADIILIDIDLAEVVIEPGTNLC